MVSGAYCSHFELNIADSSWADDKKDACPLAVTV